MFNVPKSFECYDTVHKKRKPNEESLFDFSTDPSVKKTSILTHLKNKNRDVNMKR